MAHLAVSNLAYAHPGGDLLFTDVSFTAAPGRHIGVVGANGVGKSTMFRVIAGELEAEDGAVSSDGGIAYMPQDGGVRDGGATVRDAGCHRLPTATSDPSSTAASRSSSRSGG